MENNVHSRILGLDVARAVAILMVLGAHFSFFWLSLNILTPKRTAFSIVLGTLGVELFFVLSGFLIGGLLLRDIFQPSLKKTGIFFIRRWLRTLPAYYTVFFILYIIDFYVYDQEFRLIYLIFIQNFDNGSNNFFPVSWTLAIEQWTYLVAPLVLYLLPSFIRKNKRKISLESAIFIALGIILALFLFLRILVVLAGEPTWDTDIRKQIPLRLDAIFFGILIVCIKKFIPNFYNVLKSGLFFACIYVLIFIYSIFLYECLLCSNIDTSFFHRTLGFSLCDILMAFTLPFFDQNALANEYLRRNIKISFIFSWISKHAYSLYLIHFTIFFLAYKFFSVIIAFVGSKANVIDYPYNFWLISAWVLTILIAFLCTITISYLLFRFIERPGINLRRFIPHV